MKRATSTTKTITIEGHEITLLRSQRRRSLCLEVDPTGIRARAPLHMPENQIIQFIRAKHDWLNQQLRALPALSAPIILKHGASVLYRGESITLQQLQGRQAPSFISANQLRVPIVSSHLSTHESLRRKLIIWYKRQALQVLSNEVASLLPIMQPGKKSPELKVREYKRRWGSCSHTGNLSFNWRLIMAPPEIMRYVVIHELAHRDEFNHSKRFWKLVHQQDPDWRRHQSWLQRNGGELYRF